MYKNKSHSAITYHDVSDVGKNAALTNSLRHQTLLPGAHYAMVAIQPIIKAAQCIIDLNLRLVKLDEYVSLILLKPKLTFSRLLQSPIPINHTLKLLLLTLTFFVNIVFFFYLWVHCYHIKPLLPLLTIPLYYTIIIYTVVVRLPISILLLLFYLNYKLTLLV